MAELERITSKQFEELSIDERYSMRYQIIVLAEAIGSLCLHISIEELGYEPDSYSDCLSRLKDAGIIDCAEDLVKIIRMRNLLVHRYWNVDDSMVTAPLEATLSVLTDF